MHRLSLLAVVFLCSRSVSAADPPPVLRSAPGMNRESCPAIVCCGGRWESHGQPLSRTWVKLGATAKAGSTTVMLAEPVTGWKAGDRVILTGTNVYGARKTASNVEERTV